MALPGPVSQQMLEKLKSLMGEFKKELDSAIEQIAHCQDDASEAGTSQILEKKLEEDSSQAFLESDINQTLVDFSKLSLGSPLQECTMEEWDATLCDPVQPIQDGANPLSEDLLSQLGTSLNNFGNSTFKLVEDYPVVAGVAGVATGAAIAWCLYKNRATQVNPAAPTNNNNNPQDPSENNSKKTSGCSIL